MGRRTPPDRVRRRRRLALLLLAASALAGLAVVAPAAFLAPVPPAWAPEPLAHWALDMRLALGTPVKGIESLRRGRLADRRLLEDSAGPTIVLGGGADRLVGTLYLPGPGGRGAAGGGEAGGSGAAGAAGAAGAPAVLLLHGSTPAGRKLGLYRALAQALSRRGILVLNLDQRGYGDSADPANVDDPRSYAFVHDVERAVRYLAARADVDPARVHVLGHSFGGSVALASGASVDGLASVIAIGPGRRFMERVGHPGAPQLHYFRRREMRYLRLPEEPPESTFLRVRTRLPIESQHGYYDRPGHVPLLLVDGSLEDPRDLEFLEREYRRMARPAQRVTLEGVDHYINVADVGPLVVYDRDALDRLMAVLEPWILEHRLSTNRRADGATGPAGGPVPRPASLPATRNDEGGH